ncbi:hypothetical protein CVT24_000847 [Panaeolus cyanescens]|uniref:CENP-V/GFA domain-containing protein n=1 Tax=Panaeolus cyanescens TaxID=181874 RepID=A0A409VVI7_9AGAR|nr:hypothetical protein CVT24_000847 [Panaeolus cyanescens]
MHQPPSKKPIAFDFVVVGAGGGPDETNLSAYLVKPHSTSWEDGVVALEAGSGQGTLAQLLRSNPNIFSKPEDKNLAPGKRYTASEIYSFVKCFLITHAHLDHINSLIISAGSFKGSRKRIYALNTVLKDMELVFADRIWPNLASWKEEDDDYKLLYSNLETDGRYKRVFPDISVQSMPLNHGCNALGHYSSTAFFVRHDPTLQEFILFGDVEPDSLVRTPRTIDVWRAAAPKVPSKLSTIFIECSWPSGRKDELLFGHLTPEHLVDELTTLATEVVKYRQNNSHTDGRRRPRKRQRKNSLTTADLANALDGLRVYVIHCKDDFDSTSSLPIREVIVQQVCKLVEDKNLGAQILAAEQGMHIVQYEINLSSPEDARTSICHCRNCRKFTGSPFGTTTKVPPGSLHFKDESTLKTHVSDNGGAMLTRQFCGECGSGIVEWGESAGETSQRREWLPEVPETPCTNAKVTEVPIAASQTDTVATDSKETLGEPSGKDKEILEDPVPLRPLTSLNWPYVPEESAYPDPLKRDDPKMLQTHQYEAIGMKVLADNPKLPEFLTEIDKLRGQDREQALQRALGVTPADITGRVDGVQVGEDVLALRALAEAVEAAVRGDNKSTLGLDWGE